MAINKGSTEIGKAYKGNIQIGKIYKGNTLIYSSGEVVTLEAKGQCHNSVNEQYAHYETTYTIPSGVTKAIITDFFVSDMTFGTGKGYIYFNNGFLGSMRLDYIGSGEHMLTNGITLPIERAVKEGDVFMVVAECWTNANVSTYSPIFSVTASITLE